MNLQLIKIHDNVYTYIDISLQQTRIEYVKYFFDFLRGPHLEIECTDSRIINFNSGSI